MAGPDGRAFWTSLPGVLTGVAGLITAVTAAWVAFGSHSGDDRPAAAAAVSPGVPGPSAETRPIVAGLPKAGIAIGTLPNLLRQTLGGRLVFATQPHWEKTNDGDDDQAVEIGQRVGDYGIFAFRDRGLARLSSFAITVPAASGLNPTAIDLSYATGSEDGPFLPIGEFRVRNGRVPPDGRQVFRFDPVTARYLKVTLRETYSGAPYVSAYEFMALGELVDG